MSVHCSRCEVAAECEALPHGIIECQDNAARHDGVPCVRCGSQDTYFTERVFPSGYYRFRCQSCDRLFTVDEV